MKVTNAASVMKLSDQQLGSPRSQLLDQTARISAQVDKGVKGFWPLKPMQLLAAAHKIAGEGSVTRLLKSTASASHLIDRGARGLWTVQVSQLLEAAGKIAGA
jgi:hypothetical protein